MLDLKGVEYELVDAVPMHQRIHLWLAGFPAGAVPAISSTASASRHGCICERLRRTPGAYAMAEGPGGLLVEIFRPALTLFPPHVLFCFENDTTRPA